MGKSKKNPIKQGFKSVTGAIFNPVREVARAVGVKDAVKGIDNVNREFNKHHTDVLDLVNNEKGKTQKKNDIRDGADLANAAAASAASTAASTAKETAEMEAERMLGGSKSRTLLTGPAGLEDEEENITRRTLAGRR